MKRKKTFGLDKPAITSATPQEAENYGPDKKGLGPSSKNFRLDLARKGLASDWNKEAARVFTRHFVKTGNYTCKNVSSIQKAFMRHVVSLRRQYIAFNSKVDFDPFIVDGKAQDNARLARRREVRSSLSITSKC